MYNATIQIQVESLVTLSQIICEIAGDCGDPLVLQEWWQESTSHSKGAFGPDDNEYRVDIREGNLNTGSIWNFDQSIIDDIKTEYQVRYAGSRYTLGFLMETFRAFVGAWLTEQTLEPTLSYTKDEVTALIVRALSQVRVL